MSTTTRSTARRPPPTPIPQTRLGRIAQIGLAAGGLAVGAAAEGLRRFARGEASDFGSVFGSQCATARGAACPPARRSHEARATGLAPGRRHPATGIRTAYGG